MNTKQLIAALAMLLLAITPLFAESVIPNSSPQYKASKYSYADDDKPDVWFFPKDTARWDGYKVTVWNWVALTELQKDMFISEGIAEIEKNKNATVTVENKLHLLNAVNEAVNTMTEQYPDIKTSMLSMLLDTLKETNSITYSKK